MLPVRADTGFSQQTASDAQAAQSIKQLANPESIPHSKQV